MMGLTKTPAGSESVYREEPPRLAIAITLVAVAVVGIPLGLFNKKIVDEGSRSADVSKYTALATQVNGTVKVVRDMLEKGVVSDVALSGVTAPSVKLIVPQVNPTNMQEAADQDPNKLNVKLSGIYWSERDPLVSIDGDNYRVGDKIHGFTILEIRKTEVVFRSPLGEKVIKYFYVARADKVLDCASTTSPDSDGPACRDGS